MKLTLSTAWNKRARFRAKGNKFELEGDKFWKKAEDFQTKANRLWMKGIKLRAEGDKVWMKAILTAFGNIKIGWEYVPEKKDRRYRLENGEVYEPK